MLEPSRLRMAGSRLRTPGFAGLAVFTGVALAACGSSSPSTSSSGSPSSSSSSNPLASAAPSGSVVVGSANFPENELLAEIYVLALQGKGVKVTPKFNIGAREVYYPEIKKGAVTIIPEYNGALLTTSVDPSSTAASTAQVDAALTAELPSYAGDPQLRRPRRTRTRSPSPRPIATAHHLTSIAQLDPARVKTSPSAARRSSRPAPTACRA